MGAGWLWWVGRCVAGPVVDGLFFVDLTRRVCRMHVCSWLFVCLPREAFGTLYVSGGCCSVQKCALKSVFGGAATAAQLILLQLLLWLWLWLWLMRWLLLLPGRRGGRGRRREGVLHCPDGRRPHVTQRPAQGDMGTGGQGGEWGIAK